MINLYQTSWAPPCSDSGVGNVSAKLQKENHQEDIGRRLSLPMLLPAVAVVVTAVAGRAIMNQSADGMSLRGNFALCAAAPRQDCVIDGDTIRYGGVRIRLEDIDAPETHSP